MGNAARDLEKDDVLRRLDWYSAGVLARRGVNLRYPFERSARPFVAMDKDGLLRRCPDLAHRLGVRLPFASATSRPSAGGSAPPAAARGAAA